MKAILEFTLPEEEQEFKRASQAESLTWVISNYVTWLRDQRKHQNLTKDAKRFADKSWDVLHEYLQVENVSWVVL